MLLSHYLEIPFSIAILISKTIIIKIAAHKPNLPISSAIFYNFICKGVAPTYSWTKWALILPIHEESPTTITKSFP